MYPAFLLFSSLLMRSRRACWTSGSRDFSICSTALAVERSHSLDKLTRFQPCSEYNSSLVADFATFNHFLISFVAHRWRRRTWLKVRHELTTKE